LKFFGNAFFIPIFYIATGFLIDPLVFIPSIIDNFSLVSAICVALIAGKWIAAEVAGRAFRYRLAARMTMWSLTLPQVATTLAATLVAFNTFDPLHQRLIDDRMLHVVLVLMLITATLGAVLTQYVSPYMLNDSPAKKALNA
jgi:Kef-type K+ transport system membrane component KefB